MQSQHRKKNHQKRQVNGIIINTVTVQKHAVTAQKEKPSGTTSKRHYKHSNSTETCINSTKKTQQERQRNGIINTATAVKWNLSCVMIQERVLCVMIQELVLCVVIQELVMCVCGDPQTCPVCSDPGICPARSDPGICPVCGDP